MSVYESISRKQLNLKRRLFDDQVERNGQQIKVIRLSYREDIFQDLTDINILSSDLINVVIKFPDAIPLERFRADGTESVDDTRTFFFDLLPIDAYTKFEDHVEVRDILFFEYKDEKDNTIPMLLQVTETFGKIDCGLVWKKAYVAPQHGALPQNIYKELKKEYESKKVEEPLVREEQSESENPDLVREKRIRDLMG